MQDDQGNPIAGVKITAEQLEPIQGFERREVTTDQDGTFLLRQLFPQSEYVFYPSKEQDIAYYGRCTVERYRRDVPERPTIKSGTAPAGYTKQLDPLVVAFALSGTGVLVDLKHHGDRFELSNDEIIRDSQTDREWYIGPPEEVGYAQALRWVQGLAVGGGGWRLPTAEEAKGICFECYPYSQNIDHLFLRNDPVFLRRVTRGGVLSIWVTPGDHYFYRGDIECQAERFRNPRDAMDRVFAIREAMPVH